MSYRLNADAAIDVSTEQPLTFDRLRAVIDKLERSTADRGMHDVHIIHIEMSEWDSVFEIDCGADWITQADCEQGVSHEGTHHLTSELGESWLSDLPDTP